MSIAAEPPAETTAGAVEQPVEGSPPEVEVARRGGAEGESPGEGGEASGAGGSGGDAPGAVSVREELRERVIVLRTMSRPLRALTLFAMAGLVAAFVLGLLVHAGLPQTTISAAGAGPIRLPLPGLVLIVAAFGLAWCYAITASLYVHPLLRVAILGVFTLAMLDQGTLLSPAFESGRSALLAAGLVALWLIVFGSSIPAWRDRLMAWAGPAVFVLTAAVQVLAWWSSRAARIPGVFAFGFVFDLTLFAVLVSVYLAAAGAEFAQVADLVSGAIASRFAQRSRWLIAAAAGALACLLLARAVVGAPSSVIWNALLCVGAAAVVVALFRLRRGSWARAGRLPSWAALVTGALSAAALMAATGLATPGAGAASQFQLTPPTLVYHHASAPSFSIAYPPNWTIKSLVRPAGLSEFELNGQTARVSSLGELFAFQRSAGARGGLSTAQALATVRQVETLHFSGLTAVVVPTASPYRYSLGVAVGNRIGFLGRVGLFWTPRYLWVVQVIATPVWWRPMSAVADYMVNSWRPDGSAPPVDLSPAVSTRTPTAYFAAIGLGLALVIALTLMLVATAPLVGVALRCMFVAMLLVGLVNFRELAGLLTGHYHVGVPHLNMRAVELVLGLALAGAIAISLRAGRWRDRASAALPRLAVFGASILVLSLLFSLYAGAAVATLTVAGVAFLLAAFLWDLVLSGEIVNRDGKLVRRPGRVLLYLSYLLATSAATLYFASSRNLGTLKVDDAFGPEAQAALSVFFVGIAWAVTSFLVRMGSGRAGAGSADSRPADSAPAQSAP